MKHLIESNYKSILKRGLINESTISLDFIMKLEEEVQEFIDAEKFGLENEREELADIILVCLNYARHYDIDIENELKNKIIINNKRND